MSELPKLHYFNFRGKGELVRLTFAAAGAPFDDIRYKPPLQFLGPPKGLDWDADAKTTTPLGQLPVLEIDGQKFCQQSAIARFVARKFGLMGDDEIQALKIDMVVETMWPDVAMKCIGILFEGDEARKAAMKDKITQSMPSFLENIAKWIDGEFVMGVKLSLADLAIFDAMSIVEKHFPDMEIPEAIQRVRGNVKEHPNVKKWLNTRPKSDF